MVSPYVCGGAAAMLSGFHLYTCHGNVYGEIVLCGFTGK